MTDDSTLTVLARSLKLIILIQDLVSTNKSLRADWEERKMPILTLVRDLATVSLGTIVRRTHDASKTNSGPCILQMTLKAQRQYRHAVGLFFRSSKLYQNP